MGIVIERVTTTPIHDANASARAEMPSTIAQSVASNARTAPKASASRAPMGRWAMRMTFTGCGTA
jgi:hypothetical protein